MLKKIILFCLFLVLSLKFSVGCAFAKDFSSFNKTTYRFDESGEAFISQEVSMVNLSSQYYVSEYTFSILGSSLEKIKAFDHVGPIKTDVLIKGGNTLITLHFNDKVVGKDKMLSFIIKFQSKDFAKKEGNLWQISIPKLVESGNVGDYQLIVSIPSSLGRIAYSNPTPKEETFVNNTYQLKFLKDDLTNFGALITVGKYQTFDFKINYQLSNDRENPVIQEITLPPDTDYQTIYYKNLEPKPENVKEDSDGNWLASYVVPPKKTLNILAEGQANIFFQNKGNEIKTGSLRDYLKSTKYWPADNPEIKALAEKLKTPEKIYRFVVDNLSYDYSLIDQNIKRKGALLTLSSPKESVCTDFTDLFIAIARSAGIPARELNGFAFSDNPKLNELSEQKDILHSWPEYFDKERNMWVMIDPTWENTSGGVDFFNKFDMSHFVFVTHGKEDNYPPSPGAFKNAENSEKQIFINFGKELSLIKPRILSFSSITPEKLYSLKENKVSIELFNDSGFTINNEKYLIFGDGIKNEINGSFEKIIPFAKTRVVLSLFPSDQLKDRDLEIIIKTKNQVIKIPFTVFSLPLRLALLAGLIIAVILFISLRLLRKNRAKQELLKNDNL